MRQTLHRYNLFAGLVLALLIAGPQYLAALGGIEGTFEYAIDAPWRMEPYPAANGQLTYSAIPIQITIHDAREVKRDKFHFANSGGTVNENDVSQALDLGKVCRVMVTETSTNQSRTYTFQDFAEVEATHGAWPWPPAAMPSHSICRAWQGDNCTPLQNLSQTSEWHALLWHTPLSATTPGNSLGLTVEVELTRHASTGCTQPPTEEEFVSGITRYRVPSVISLRNHLRVHFGEAPLPRFDDAQTQWLYGDLHYHSQGTDNEGESAYNYRGVIRAMGAMGLDFAFATEHASNSEQIIDGDISIDFDMPSSIDWNPLDVDAHGVGDVLRDMSPQRFAFNHGLLHGSQGVNQQAALLGANGLPAGVRSHGVVPQLFLGGELDAVPEARGLDPANPVIPYGNGLTYDIGRLCEGWKSIITDQSCPRDELLVHKEDGSVLIRDIQGVNTFRFGREHLVYMPRTADLDVPGTSPYEPMCMLCEFRPGDGEDVHNCEFMTCEACTAEEIPQRNVCRPVSDADNMAFISSDTGQFGGALRRLTEWLSTHPPLLPEIEWKGYAFLAHHMNAPGGSPAPEGPPWSEHMLQQAWSSPGILGLQFWNENARLVSELDSQQSDGDDGIEIGYSRVDGISAPKPVNGARAGFVTAAGLFELIPYDLTTERWGKGNVPGVERTLHHGASSWDHINLWGLDPTRTAQLPWLAPGEPRRFFMAGGSDAHGDLNYRREGYFQGTTAANDTALGSPRNLVQVDRTAAVPAGSGTNQPVVYRHETVVQALANGNFAVTDGPALRIVVDRNQNGQIDHDDIPMGGIVHLYGETTLPLLVEWKSTPEFNAVELIDLYVGAQKGADGRTYAPYQHGPQGSGLPGPFSAETPFERFSDGYWHANRGDPASVTYSLRIADGVIVPEPQQWELCLWVCADPAGADGCNGQIRRQNWIPASAEICEDLESNNDPLFCGCRIAPPEPPQYVPLPANVYAGMRAVELDLSAYEVATNVVGERFFVRAFAKTYPQAHPTQSTQKNIRRYAFTNPVWAITQPDDGTCPEDPQALDRDEDGLPDGCDPEPEVPQPDRSACQSSVGEPPEVHVDLTTMTACGSFAGARYSTDATQYVLCRVQALETDTAPYTVCEARDLQGDTLTCLGTAGYVDAVLGMPDYGYVQFTAAVDAQGVKRCTSLEVGTFAPLLP